MKVCVVQPLRGVPDLMLKVFDSAGDLFSGFFGRFVLVVDGGRIVEIGGGAGELEAERQTVKVVGVRWQTRCPSGGPWMATVAEGRPEWTAEVRAKEVTG